MHNFDMATQGWCSEGGQAVWHREMGRQPAFKNVQVEMSDAQGCCCALLHSIG